MSEEQPPPVLYLDRALGRHAVAAALRAASLTVEIHDDHFAQEARDVDWLPAVAVKGWVVLTKKAAVGSPSRIRPDRAHPRRGLLAPRLPTLPRGFPTYRGSWSPGW